MFKVYFKKWSHKVAALSGLSDFSEEQLKCKTGCVGRMSIQVTDSEKKKGTISKAPYWRTLATF